MSNDGDGRHEEFDSTLTEDDGVKEKVSDEAAESAIEPRDDSQPSSVSEDQGAETDGEDDPEKVIAELELDVANLNDQLLRKTAEFDNYRKRMLKEKEDFAAYANTAILEDIVPIIDNFELAIKSADESKDFNAFHDGIVLIEKQFIGMLERKWKLVRFESVGEEFDPQKHEALMTEERPDHDRSIVLEDFQKGYLLHDRVLRSAKVKVSMPTGDTVSKGAESSEESEE